MRRPQLPWTELGNCWNSHDKGRPRKPWCYLPDIIRPVSLSFGKNDIVLPKGNGTCLPLSLILLVPETLHQWEQNVCCQTSWFPRLVLC